METTYKPNGYSEAIVLPVIPPSISLSSHRAGTGLQQWFRGLSSTPVPYFSAEAIEITEARWRTKWEYYQQTFREDIEQPGLQTMSGHDLIEHVTRLDSEFTRLRERFIEIDAIKASAETATGVQFIVSLMEEQTPVIFSLKATQQAEDLEALRSKVSAVNRVYHFALQASDTIHRMKAMDMMALRVANAEENAYETRDLEKGSQSSVEVRSSYEGSPVGRSTPELPNADESQRVRFSETMTSPRFRENSTYPPSGSSAPPSATVFNTAPSSVGATADSSDGPELQRFLASQDPYARPPRPQRRSGNGEPAPAPAPTQTLSTEASHRSNLVSLSAIAFFGAGMAWATVFSGTRGDLVLIAWAACCFIVGAVSAASATSLLDADGELLNRYKPVRWTVRLLALLSTVHVFVGVMLVSAAILELDPNSPEPKAGMNGSDFRIRNGRVAGGYSLVLSAIAVFVALAVRHRYSRRTWFV